MALLVASFSVCLVLVLQNSIDVFSLLKVVIVAKGKLPSDVYHAAVDNISVSSKQCERSPPHSTPGMSLCSAFKTVNFEVGIPKLHFLASHVVNLRMELFFSWRQKLNSLLY